MDSSSSPTDHGQTVKHAEGIEEVPQAQAWQNMRVIDENISAYMDFYNNATNVSIARSVPAERYHGFIDEGRCTKLKCLN